MENRFKMLKQFYDLALIEGQGLGTAYEYLAKYRILKPCLENEKTLIYGLPEKYGFSLDILYLLDKSGCEIHVYEDREEKIKQYSKIIEALVKKRFIQKIPLIIDEIKERYDLVLSSEVIQKFDNRKLQDYSMNIKKFSKKAIIFFPNGNNKAHHSLTKLRTYKPESLSNFFSGKVELGFVDMPPFPPGLRVKSNQTHQNLKLLIPLLSSWLFIEQVCPRFVKKRFCHIAYLSIKNKK